MKIYYDDTRDLIFIEGLKQVFAPQSLTAVVVNNQIAIRLINDSLNLIGPLDFNAFQNKDGVTFNNILSTHTYLLGEFVKDGIPANLDLVGLFNSNL